MADIEISGLMYNNLKNIIHQYIQRKINKNCLGEHTSSDNYTEITNKIISESHEYFVNLVGEIMEDYKKVILNEKNVKNFIEGEALIDIDHIICFDINELIYEIIFRDEAGIKALAEIICQYSLTKDNDFKIVYSLLFKCKRLFYHDGEHYDNMYLKEIKEILSSITSGVYKSISVFRI